MSPDGTAWARKQAAIWSARAAELRALGGPLNVNLALGLELSVAAMVAGLPAAEVASPLLVAVPADDAIEHHLAACASRVDPATGVTINGGPIMMATREDLRTRLAGSRGGAGPMVAVVPAPATVSPPAEPVPFTVGPQLDLFGLAA